MVSLDLAHLISREVNRAAPATAPAVSLTAAGVDSPALVSGDEHRLSEVLRNLLANAVRHTPSGSIRVDLASDARSYRVSVIDTGEGIPPEDLAYVFERFYRADAARANHTGGAGLGLAISRRIVLDHGGDMFAEPTPGGGATVGFTLPSAD